MKRFLSIFLCLSCFFAAISNVHMAAVDAGVVEHRSNDPIIFNDNYIPFYGGQRQRQFALNNQPLYKISNQLLAADSQNGPTAATTATATITDDSRDVAITSTFEQDFYKIQLAAARLVSIQDKAKRQGSLSAEDNKIYADSLIELGQAAQSLAKLQQNGQIQDFSLLFQPITGLMPQKEQQPSLVTATVESSSTTIGEQKGDEATEQQQQLTEDDMLSPNPDDPYEDVNDSVAITAPKKDASVAEAKPIGLSIAGEGGVASSKPNAVALSGRNGLAVSAPKATAIAGVSPEEAAAFSISLPSRNHLVIKNLPVPASVSTTQSINQRIQNPTIAYDDYDYVDLNSRDTNLPNDSTLRLRPKVTTEKFFIKNTKSVSSGDEFVNNWKTLIAEDYAAGPIIDERRILNPKLRFALKP